MPNELLSPNINAETKKQGTIAHQRLKHPADCDCIDCKRLEASLLTSNASTSDLIQQRLAKKASKKASLTQKEHIQKDTTLTSSQIISPEVTHPTPSICTVHPTIRAPIVNTPTTTTTTFKSTKESAPTTHEGIHQIAKKEAKQDSIRRTIHSASYVPATNSVEGVIPEPRVITKKEPSHSQITSAPHHQSKEIQIHRHDVKNSTQSKQKEERPLRDSRKSTHPSLQHNDGPPTFLKKIPTTPVVTTEYRQNAEGSTWSYPSPSKTHDRTEHNHISPSLKKVSNNNGEKEHSPLPIKIKQINRVREKYVQNTEKKSHHAIANSIAKSAAIKNQPAQLSTTTPTPEINIHNRKTLSSVERNNFTPGTTLHSTQKNTEKTSSISSTVHNKQHIVASVQPTRLSRSPDQKATPLSLQRVAKKRNITNEHRIASLISLQEQLLAELQSLEYEDGFYRIKKRHHHSLRSMLKLKNVIKKFFRQNRKTKIVHKKLSFQSLATALSRGKDRIVLYLLSYFTSITSPQINAR